MASTVVELDEDVRRAFAARAREKAARAATFRPLERPPTAVLTVCDDGRSEGEAIRIRGERFVIGRTEGDLRIAHDPRVSARHVEIVRKGVGGSASWAVVDVGSRNGLFVRVSHAPLADGAEFLVGRGRYRFDDPRPGSGRPPALREPIDGGRVVLTGSECWIGSDPSCLVARPDDPFCEPRHARLRRGPRGRWRVEHDHTLNGLWLRVARIAVDRTLHFQLGEQRFRLQVG
ncbi:FHA domain-containing protein [Paludisphaera mucosa]|uniref:FHA domain-containing protein n=1 Tax=Paludisphaera mucosa TaxID=3030827 RepID=A0ABT6FC13_9BACT|nr:FHA domain-containing protein [Paludisphaera mucosa]MDG3005124.1 FHA domain-containing protein [Paludisphaera mucosa]